MRPDILPERIDTGPVWLFILGPVGLYINRQTLQVVPMIPMGHTLISSYKKENIAAITHPSVAVQMKPVGNMPARYAL